MIKHVKEFGIYHWDTFDNITILLAEYDKKAEALKFVEDRYKNRLRADGADRVEIVNSLGDIVEAFNVG